MCARAADQDEQVLAPPDHHDFDSWVSQLADTVRAQRAYRHLVLSGGSALPAIRAGLRSPEDSRRGRNRISMSPSAAGPIHGSSGQSTDAATIEGSTSPRRRSDSVEIVLS